MANAIPDSTSLEQPAMTVTGWLTCILIIPAICFCLSLLLAVRLFPYQPHVIWPFVIAGTLLTLLIPSVGQYWYRTVTAVLTLAVSLALAVATFYLVVFVIFPWWADNGEHWWAYTSSAH